MAVILEHSDARAADKHIAHHAPAIGHLAEENITQGGGKEDLRVVIDAYFLSRGAEVSAGDAELTDAGGGAAQKQHQQLVVGEAHGAEHKKRQGQQRGKE